MASEPTAKAGGQRFVSEVLIGLLVFVLFLLVYILLGETAGPPAMATGPGGISTSTPDRLTLQEALLLVSHSPLLLPATALLGGGLGAVYWRLISMPAAITGPAVKKK